MAKITTDSKNYTDIANAINRKTKANKTYLPSEMAPAIDSIPEEEKPPYDLNHYFPLKACYLSLNSTELEQYINRGGTMYTNMDSFFYNDVSLSTIPEIDTSNVKSMRYMFASCSNLQKIPQLNTSSCTTFRSMFKDCKKLTFIPKLDLSAAIDCNGMFSGCGKLRNIPNFNTSNVKDMSGMFMKCSSIQTLPQLQTSNVERMSYMFNGAWMLTEIPGFDCSKVNDMTNIFGNPGQYDSLSELTAIHLKNINTNLDISITSNNLSREAIVEVLNNLMDRNGQEQKTLTIGPTLDAKLTDNDRLIATNKNWILA